MKTPQSKSTKFDEIEGMAKFINGLSPHNLHRGIELLRELVESKVLEGREIFVPIKGFEGLYEVSNTGKVRSLPGGKRKGAELKPANIGSGVNGFYARVSLVKDGRVVNDSVHRLVAHAFISNPNNHPWINHIDGVKQNNNVENLEWCDATHNNRHAIRTGLNNIVGTNSTSSKFTEQDVIDIRTQEGKINAKILAKQYGVHWTTIYNLWEGKYYKAELEATPNNLTKKG